MPQISNSDWREPLYQCALSHKESGSSQRIDLAILEFSFLGSFRDSQDLLLSCRQEKEKLVKEALTSEDLHTAVLSSARLKSCTELEDYEQILPALITRKEELKAREKRRRKKKRLLLCALIVIFALLLTALLIWNFSYRQSFAAGRISELKSQEKYEEAIDVCRHLLFGPHAEEASEELPGLYHELGVKKREQGEYPAAISAFEQYQEEKEIRDTRIAYADALAEEGAFEEAVSQLSETGSSLLLQDMYLTWCLDAEERGEYQEALDAAENLAPGKETEELIARLRDKRLIYASETLLGEGTLPGEDALPIISFGENLHDLKSILTFCRMLMDHNLDPGELFPEGLLVTDLDLDSYRAVNESRGFSFPEHIKVLAFSRKTVVSDLSVPYYSKSPLKDPMLFMIPTSILPYEDINEDTVLRFLPGETYSLPEEYWPEDPSECSFYLLKDTYFLTCGTAQLKKRIGTGSAKTTYFHDVIMFEAVDNVTLYRKDQPEQFFTIGSQINYPEASLQPLNGRPISPTLNDSADVYPKLWGTSSPGFLNETMEKGLALFS